MTPSDQQRFASLYESHHRQVQAYCRRRTDESSVDDLVAEVFLTVWRKINSAPDGEGALPWLYRVAYLVMTNHWRATGRRQKLNSKLENIGVEPVPLVQDQVVVREEVREVLDVARRLREKDQEVLRLSLWEELSMEAIGEVLGVSPNTAKQRLFRARAALVREYEKRHKDSAVSPAAQEGGEW